MTKTMTPVKSSTIKSVGYHDGELRVAFHSGAHYAYTGNHADTGFPMGDHHHKALTEGESAGKHFHAQIRDQYDTRKVPAGEEWEE